MDAEEDLTVGSFIQNLASVPEQQPSPDDSADRVDYGLKTDEISETLSQQAKAFSEFRQETWSFDRDGSKVGSTTVSNNLKVLFLFGGYCIRKQRVKEFDFSVFSDPQLEQYVLGFLNHLRSSRGLAF